MLPRETLDPIRRSGVALKGPLATPSGSGWILRPTVGSDVSMFEAVHGFAPDIAGQGVANPGALLLAAAMMLDHVAQLDVAERVRSALQLALTDPSTRTRDLAATANTEGFVTAVLDHLS